ncbi:MAG: C-GCAxxG-C-C family protein [Clostridiales bacterium]
MNRKEKAIQNYKDGYNCSQSVICAYADIWGIEENVAYRISEGYGGGMGQLGEVCGAVSAMFSAVGLKNSGGLEKIGETKKTTYGVVKNMAMEFENKHHSILCRELLKDDSRPKQEICLGCVADACDIIESTLID